MLFGKVEDTDVAETDACPVAAETDMSALVEHSRMVPVVDGVRVGAASIRSDIVSLAGLAQIAVKDNFTIQGHGDTVSHHLDFFLVPSPERLVYNTLRRNDTVG